MQTTEGKLNNFGFKGWHFTAEFELFGKVEMIYPTYDIYIKPIGNEQRLIEDHSVKEFNFKAITTKSVGFNKITFRVDPETIIKLTDLVCCVSKFSISMEACMEDVNKIVCSWSNPVYDTDDDETDDVGSFTNELLDMTKEAVKQTNKKFRSKQK